MGSDDFTQLDNSDSHCSHRELWEHMLSLSHMLLTLFGKMLKPWKALAVDTDSNRHSSCDTWAAAKLMLV